MFVAGSDKLPDGNQMLRYLRKMMVTLEEKSTTFYIQPCSSSHNSSLGTRSHPPRKPKERSSGKHSEPKPIQYHAAIALKLTLPINVQSSSLCLLNRETHPQGRRSSARIA